MDPVLIYVGRQKDGCTYQLHPSSRTRIQKKFPDAHIAPSVFVGYETQSDFEMVHGPLWEQVAQILTGLNLTEIESLGGFKIFDPTTGREVQKVV
ncbi:MAG: hypothetical protein A3F84_17790 [Candidatus Handelsmanbacteria bacterium RIFCSPLOWO2_12_FULL_64_10]|uniref:Uncharacterized protein n=1 Tax=Handelsmanbacteria sp. (strain RIFCSPLOWO2_12_FULL_64_10) TaxID=1817868 RepID=A0A1F6CN90_HANXR|nr:MAG: hypothetical protein A3F84_17790 [Candidatus Handelsmanbacteria bacterium RIFCSPLOWO2_12_FULL_64_10]